MAEEASRNAARMNELRVERMDITRNERGEILLSLAVPAAPPIQDPYLLFRREGQRGRGVIRDRMAPTATPRLLPWIPEQAVAWLEGALPYRRSDQPENPLPGDHRIDGARYVLVCEVVNDAPLQAYYARLQRVTS